MFGLLFGGLPFVLPLDEDALFLLEFASRQRPEAFIYGRKLGISAAVFLLVLFSMESTLFFSLMGSAFTYSGDMWLKLRKIGGFFVALGISSSLILIPAL